MKSPSSLEQVVGDGQIPRRMISERASQRAFFGISALLFAASAAGTIVWCASMPAMGGAADHVTVRPGQTDWDEPALRLHRLVTIGATPYEEVTIFFLEAPGVDPQQPVR